MRKHYKPVQSILCNSSDPVAVAESFLGKLGLSEIYIADLDAIQAGPEENNRPVVEKLAGRRDFEIILDAGISDVESAIRWIDSGIRKLVIGSETLPSLQVLADISDVAGANRIVFSLDCYHGKTLSRCPELEGASPLRALERIEALGFREVILLELDRVGSGGGVNFPLASEIRNILPEMSLFLGGGISGANEIVRLRSMGVEGVLVATALHNGIVGPEQLAEILR